MAAIVKGKVNVEAIKKVALEIVREMQQGNQMKLENEVLGIKRSA